jgi:hypothetical protein
MRRAAAILFTASFLVAATGSSALASTEPYTVVGKIALDGTVIADICTGEDVVLAGDYLWEVHGTVTETGPYHAHYVIAYQGVEGTGQTTSDRYRFAGASQQAYDWNGAEQYTLISQIRLVSPGSASDLVITFHVHFTTNANGEVTTDSYELTTECYG